MPPVKKKGLGRGLDALFAAQNENAEASGDAREISLFEIDPNPRQARKQFDPEALTELTDSIRAHGLLQPLVVTPRGNRYLLVAGERRWRASRNAGLTAVPVRVLQLDDRQVAELSLIENLQRQDLNPLEEAEGLSQLMEQFGMTQEEAARRVGRSRPAVANALRLLQLDAAVQALVRSGELSAGHARCLAGVHDAVQQLSLARLSIDQGLSVRQLEELLAKKKEEKHRLPRLPEEKAPEFLDLEEKLTGGFGMKAVVQGTLEKGKITLEYFQREDLEQLYELAVNLAAKR